MSRANRERKRQQRAELEEAKLAAEAAARLQGRHMAVDWARAPAPQSGRLSFSDFDFAALERRTLAVLAAIEGAS